MVVTIVQPVSGGPFGPGFVLSLDSDFVGPLAVGSFWRVLLTTESGGGFLWQTRSQPTTTNAKAWTYGSEGDYAQPLFPVELEAMHGDTLELKAQLVSSAVVVDEEDQLISLDLTTGAPYLLQQVIRQQGAVQVDQTAQLEVIEQAVHMDFGDLGRFGLGQLQGGVPGVPLRRHLFTPDRTGEGSLDHPVGPFDFFAFGVTWEFIDRPPGAGVVQGAPVHTPRRTIELRLVAKDVEANEYTKDFGIYREDRLYVTFNPFELTRIEYWIEPGTTVRFWWLGLP